MKHILMVLMLAAMSSAAAFPAWTEIGKNDNVIMYANLDTIPSHSKIVTVWFLAEFIHTRSKVLSSLIQQKYNCDNEFQRTLRVEIFTEHRGRGNGKNLVLPRDVRKWHRVIPDGDEELLWRAGCNI